MNQRYECITVPWIYKEVRVCLCGVQAIPYIVNESVRGCTPVICWGLLLEKFTDVYEYLLGQLHFVEGLADFSLQNQETDY